MILDIHHAQITIPKGAEDEARAFYCALLGLKEIPKPEALAGRGGFWLEVGDRQVHVGTEGDVERSRTKAHVAYLVESIDGVVLGSEILGGVKENFLLDCSNNDGLHAGMRRLDLEEQV